jgi:hypothetical protein
MNDETDEKVLERINVDVCEELYIGYEDPKINLFDKPGGLSAGAKLIATIPCSATVEVLEVREVNGITFYKVKHKDIVGWQTKRLLLGE